MIRTKSQIRGIGVDDVKLRFKELVSVDARSTTALARDPNEAPGATHVPINELDRRAELLPLNRVIATYCS